MNIEDDLMGDLFGGREGIVKLVGGLVGGKRTLHRFVENRFDPVNGTVLNVFEDYRIDCVPIEQDARLDGHVDGVRIRAGDAAGFVPATEIPDLEGEPFRRHRDQLTLSGKRYTIIAYESLETGDVVSGYTLLCRYGSDESFS